ncbi:MAG: hypothetical protein IPJ81_17090 [Chitinophagaceae bacterium]|nr:hypothetical protein [Chitinophagaceae bacterium]
MAFAKPIPYYIIFLIYKAKIMKIVKHILAVMFILSVISCGKTLNETGEPKYTGEELFRGIFFFQGDIPSQLSSFAPIKESFDKLDAVKKIEYDNFINKMVDKVKVLNPNYFGELSKAVDSKDNYAIDESLKIGAKLVEIVLSEMDEYKAYLNIPSNAFASIDFSKYNISRKEDLDALSSEMSKVIKRFSNIRDEHNVVGVAVCVVVAAVVAVAVWDAVAVYNYGAVAVYYAAVYAKVRFWGSNILAAPNYDKENLNRELIVRDIAKLVYHKK